MSACRCGDRRQRDRRSMILASPLLSLAPLRMCCSPTFNSRHLDHRLPACHLNRAGLRTSRCFQVSCYTIPFSSPTIPSANGQSTAPKYHASHYTTPREPQQRIKESTNEVEVEKMGRTREKTAKTRVNKTRVGLHVVYPNLSTHLAVLLLLLARWCYWPPHVHPTVRVLCFFLRRLQNLGIAVGTLDKVERGD